MQQTVEKISSLILLPQGEEPTVATVADKTKLDSQPFFKDALNGDKVLIYAKAGVAILYRPSLNKIVTVAPVQTVADQTLTPTPAPVTQKVSKPQIVLYNGTTKTGLTLTIERLILNGIQNVEISDRVNAVRTDYATTSVIDISGKYTDTVTEIAGLLSGKVISLPAGEERPDADILVIVGKDKVQ